MVARKKSQPKQEVNLVQASKKTQKGHKRPPKRLSEIIALVNLIPPDIDLDPMAMFPSSLRDKELPFTADQMLFAALENLAPEPDRLRQHLMEYANREDVRLNVAVLPETLKFVKASVRYQEIREWREICEGLQNESLRSQPQLMASSIGKLEPSCMVAMLSDWRLTELICGISGSVFAVEFTSRRA